MDLPIESPACSERHIGRLHMYMWPCLLRPTASYIGRLLLPYILRASDMTLGDIALSTVALSIFGTSQQRKTPDGNNSNSLRPTTLFLFCRTPPPTIESKVAKSNQVLSTRLGKARRSGRGSRLHACFASCGLGIPWESGSNFLAIC